MITDDHAGGIEALLPGTAQPDLVAVGEEAPRLQLRRKSGERHPAAIGRSQKQLLPVENGWISRRREVSQLALALPDIHQERTLPAQEVEALVIKAVRDRPNAPTEIAHTLLIQNHVTRVDVQSDQLVLELTDATGVGSKRKRKSRNLIEVPWRKTPPTRRREILVPESEAPQNIRPIRSENRALLVASIARGRRWLDELITDPAAALQTAKDAVCGGST
jgi:hypothetical protein